VSFLILPNEDEIEQIEGWFSLEEGRRLAYLASTVPPHLAIVELGSWKGRSTAFLGLGSKAGRMAHVYAVDHWKGSPEHRDLFRDPQASTFPEFKANMKWLGLDDIVTPITGKTSEVASTWDKDIGLLFIDADHAYEAVRADFLGWSPFVVPGGWVAFHDAGAPGPSRVIEEEVLASEDWYEPFSHPLRHFQKVKGGRARCRWDRDL
jgi:predicted O-methyltransferase YrrM